jgi:transposase-like protein
MGKKKASGARRRPYSAAFRLKAVQRMEAGECIAGLSRVLGVRRKVLYEWRQRYRDQGPAGLENGPGRPPKSLQEPQRDQEQQQAGKIAELERKVGQQALLIDFLRQAFKRVKESRQNNAEAGGTASTERSGA